MVVLHWDFVKCLNMEVFALQEVCIEGFCMQVIQLEVV